ncbi:MAG TPA: sigma-54-dependent Fis family transcriptional regulator, partial [Rhodospirillaceae bacterium]|nr:sigma-54-dependent Fis family transcriptional regulator [Rhodospirillaceae bacterium]
MRLLIIGTLGGQIGAASQIAMQKGAKVQQAETVDRALEQLRAGQGADLIMVDVGADIARLVTSLDSERIALPVIACGTANDSQAAVRAIKAGAKEYVPLPPDADLIAAVLHAVSDEPSTIVHGDPGMAEVIKMADQVAPSEASVLITG